MVTEKSCTEWSSQLLPHTAWGQLLLPLTTRQECRHIIKKKLQMHSIWPNQPTTACPKTKFLKHILVHSPKRNPHNYIPLSTSPVNKEQYSLPPVCNFFPAD